MHKTISVVRNREAVDKDIPIPVANATYPITHTGHFGMTASNALGTSQPATANKRCARVVLASLV
jgi:hypothetical protein